MSKLVNPFDVLDSPDSSGDFGRDEGLSAYEVVAKNHPDGTIQDSAERAARIAMIVTRRFDVNPQSAEQAIVTEMTAIFPKDSETTHSEGR